MRWKEDFIMVLIKCITCVWRHSSSWLHLEIIPELIISRPFCVHKRRTSNFPITSACCVALFKWERLWYLHLLRFWSLGLWNRVVAMLETFCGSFQACIMSFACRVEQFFSFLLKNAPNIHTKSGISTPCSEQETFFDSPEVSSILQC